MKDVPTPPDHYGEAEFWADYAEDERRWQALTEDEQDAYLAESALADRTARRFERDFIRWLEQNRNRVALADDGTVLIEAISALRFGGESLERNEDYRDLMGLLADGLEDGMSRLRWTPAA